MAHAETQWDIPGKKYVKLLEMHIAKNLSKSIYRATFEEEMLEKL